MIPRPLMVAGAMCVLVLAAGAAGAGQERPAEQEAPPPRPAAVPREPRAAPPTRAEQEGVRPPRAEPATRAVPRPAPAPAERPRAATQDRATGERQTAQPRQHTRPRGDRPVVGRAVPRVDVPVRDRFVVVRTPAFPFGHPFGSFGLGYFYYDPFWWGHPGYGYYPRAYHARAVYDTGRLRLRVRPRDAQVFVNGYYVGIVDDFDGLFQRLTLESGPHRIEIRADGYAPLIFEVLIVPGETITYRGELPRAP